MLDLLSGSYIETKVQEFLDKRLIAIENKVEGMLKTNGPLAENINFLDKFFNIESLKSGNHNSFEKYLKSMQSDGSSFKLIK